MSLVFLYSVFFDHLFAVDNVVTHFCEVLSGVAVKGGLFDIISQSLYKKMGVLETTLRNSRTSHNVTYFGVIKYTFAIFNAVLGVVPLQYC